MKIEDEQIIQKLKKIAKSGKTSQERQRAHAIVLSSCEMLKSHEIAAILGVTQRSIFNWFREYKQRGFDSLKQQKGRGAKAKLSVEKHLEIIKKHIEVNPNQPKRAYSLALEEIAIDFSYETFKRFLKKYLTSAINE